jgi:hypothetical protein
MRVADAERQRVADRLADALTEGSLSVTEFEARTVAAYAATTRGDLATASAELPRPRRIDAATPPRSGAQVVRVALLDELFGLAVIVGAVLLVVWILAV